MTETKEFIYKLEDLIALGKSLPLVAFKQLQQLAPMFDTFKDDFGISMVRRKIYDKLMEEGTPDFNEKDERALKNTFARIKRKNPDLLHYYREMNRIRQEIMESNDPIWKLCKYSKMI